MKPLRHSAAGIIAAALVAGALALAAPASGAIAVDDPPEGKVTIAAVTPGSGPVSVAVVMPLTVPPTTTGLLDATTLAGYTQPGGLLAKQLDAVIDTTVAIGLDPMVTASIQVLGTSAPPSALEFLARLRAASNQVFLLAYADADPAVAATAGATAELAPLGFDFAIDPANFGPAVTPTATTGPSATPDPTTTDLPADGPQPLPSMEDLLSWPTTLEAIAWPAEGTVTADSLDPLAALGYADVLLAGSNVSNTATALVDLGDIDGLVTDGDVTAAARDAAYAPSPSGYQEAIVRMDEALAERAAADPGRTLIVTLDRRWSFGILRVPDLIAAIEAGISSQLVPLSDVLAGPRGSAQLVETDAEGGGSRADTVGRLADAARAEEAFLVIADDATVISQPRRLALLGLSAAAWRADDTGWETATEEFTAATAATLDAVQIAEGGSDQLLLSDVSSLRMQVSNALPVAVTVYLTVRPLRPLLHVEDSSVEVVLEADSTSIAAVPVESLINGDVTVRAELHAATGQTVGDFRFVKVILRAGWETAGTLIVGSLVVLIFGGGLVRSILRKRREAAAGAAE